MRWRQDFSLSIRTSIPRGDRAPRYADQVQEASEEGPLTYDMQDKDPGKPMSRLLHKAHLEQTPLIYLQGIAPALYVSHFPVYVAEWHERAGSADIAMGLPSTDPRDLIAPAVEQQGYTQRLSKARLHQAQFRKNVLGAYGKQCALTRIKSPELIVAAHIIPDAEGGEPVVQNGLCLSQLHHAAFDAHLIGIDPDYRIHIARRLHMAGGNAFVKSSFENLAGRQIALPQKSSQRPRPESLAVRFAQFQERDA